jgi:hypothetical protein
MRKALHAKCEIGETRHTHKTRETLERSRNSHSRVDFDEDALGRLHVDLQFTRLIQGRI